MFLKSYRNVEDNVVLIQHLVFMRKYMRTMRNVTTKEAADVMVDEYKKKEGTCRVLFSNSLFLGFLFLLETFFYSEQES